MAIVFKPSCVNLASQNYIPWKLSGKLHQSSSMLAIDPQGINYYYQTSNIKCTLVGNKIVDHSEVIGALPAGTAPITSSFLT